eukprot:2547476-Pleurochrysis_carterae.AAC.2
MEKVSAYMRGHARYLVIAACRESRPCALRHPECISYCVMTAFTNVRAYMLRTTSRTYLESRRARLALRLKASSSTGTRRKAYARADTTLHKFAAPRLRQSLHPQTSST